MKKDALPRLLKLLREQEIDTFRKSANPPNNSNDDFHDLRDSSEDENNRLRGDQMTRKKRKAFSFAGLPVLATSVIRKQGEAAHNDIISKDSGETNKVKKPKRRRSYASDFNGLTETMSEAGRVRNTGAFSIVCEESSDESTE